MLTRTMTPLLLVGVALFVSMSTVTNGQGIVQSSNQYPGWNATNVAVFTTTYYSGQGCTGTVTSSYNTTTGYCTGWETYYVSADGSKLYRSDANFNNCTQVTAYYEAPMGVCVGKKMYTAINPSWGPALPVSFPPSGWALTVYYKNVTSGDITRDCSNGAGTLQYREADQMGGCYADYHYSNAPQTWSGQYCTADGEASGRVTFSDSACTNVVSTSFRPLKTCDEGYVGACPSSGGILTNFPVIAVIRADNPSCTVDTNSEINTYASNFCYNYQTVSCPTNATTGEVDVLITQYSTSDCTGTPYSTVYHKQECKVDQESYYNGVNTVYYSYNTSYSCGYSYTTGSIAGGTDNAEYRPSSSMTNASVSFMVLVLAALVAVFGGRSL